jgi:hypothetical protein
MSSHTSHIKDAARLGWSGCEFLKLNAFEDESEDDDGDEKRAWHKTGLGPV